jgi:hypothetical protein
MQRFANDAAINRKARIGTIFTFVGFGLLIASLVLSSRSDTVTYLSLGSALFGVIITQTGVTLSNKWGRRPRADEIIDASLKGLDSRYALFHYSLGSSHVLFTPSSAYTLIPCMQDGEITYTNGKWWQTRERRGKKRVKAIKNIGKEAENDARATAKKIKRLISGETIPNVEPLLVFLHPDAKLRLEESSPPAVHHKKMKPYLRKVKGGNMTSSFVDQIAETLNF